MKNFIFLMVFFALAACTDGGGGSTIEESLDDAFETDLAVSGATQNGLCYVDQYAPDEADVIRDLDIIIVPDTSTSIKEERGDIAQGFDYFLNALPEEVNVRIGVILGHSPNSNLAGKLYQKNSEPVVLDSQESSVSDLIIDLNTKLNNPKTDNKSDGGEMGQLSLELALTTNRDHLIENGLLRENASLLIVFIADEQDICFEYPDHIIPVEDKQNVEPKAKNKYCLNDEDEVSITPNSTLEAIKNAAGDRPMVVGGVIYTSLDTMPVNGENEIGYGYKEVVELAGGINVDLASGDYGPGLERLGTMARAAVKAESVFNLKSANLDLDRFNITVDGEEVPFSYVAETNQIELAEERDPFSVARIEYCEKKENPLIATQVVAGGFHTCAVYKEGTVKCWGQNNFGQLGYGHTNTLGDDESVDSIPYLDIDERVVDLSAGFAHNCAVLESGKVLCWGANDAGQLGLGHTDSVGDLTGLASAIKLDFGEKAQRIYSGTRYNCALMESQNIICWGQNDAGQLGLASTENLGDNEDYTTFPYVNVGAKILQMDISTISNHTCAALVDGDIKCWGNNQFGQLGYGNTEALGDDEVPADLDSLSFSSKILKLATGFLHTCALGAGQKIQCWGYNTLGQVGLGYVDQIGDDEAANSVGPIAMTETKPMITMATGNNHTCSIGIDHKVYCWGLGALGATGHGNNQHIGDDEAVTEVNSIVDINAEFTQISGGTNHTCALEKAEGKIICWGQNSSGQLGLGHTNNIGDNELPTEFVSLK
ncbi:MAG: hypothetical protein CME65_15025 [Halobacteriovoraceae bacterium]|nr:hypothetical protein [Halobacteriovoraceae bacterium]